MENKKKVFISVPTEGKDDAIIKRAVQLAKRSYCRLKKVSAKDIEFYDTLSVVREIEKWNDAKFEDYEEVKFVSVEKLGVSVQVIGLCDEAVFCRGWMEAKECMIEHIVCARYGIPMDDHEKRAKKFKVDKKTGETTRVK